MNPYLKGKIGIFAGIVWILLYAWLGSMYHPLWDSPAAFVIYSVLYWITANQVLKVIAK